MEKASKIVSSALLGMDGETILVNGKVYFVFPPTIKTLAGAGYYLSSFGDEKTIRDIMITLAQSMDACKALSWFIQGDEKLAEELSEGSVEDIVNALEVCTSLISTENFLKLSLLAKNVRNVIAKQR